LMAEDGHNKMMVDWNDVWLDSKRSMEHHVD
jgi:hypothetical protein